jgi:hypothetical protein
MAASMDAPVVITSSTITTREPMGGRREPTRMLRRSRSSRWRPRWVPRSSISKQSDTASSAARAIVDPSPYHRARNPGCDDGTGIAITFPHGRAASRSAPPRRRITPCELRCFAAKMRARSPPRYVPSATSGIPRDVNARRGNAVNRPMQVSHTIAPHVVHPTHRESKSCSKRGTSQRCRHRHRVG